MKPCNTCGIIKPLSEFYKSKPYKDGHQNICKDCKREKYRDYQREYSAKYRQENKEELKEKKREYYKNNINLFKEKGHSYYLKNKDQHKQRNKKYYEENRKKVRAQATIYRNKNKIKLNAQKKIYYKNNKEKHAKWHRDYAIRNKGIPNEARRLRDKKRKQNPTVRLNLSISNGIRNSLKTGKNGRHWESLVGYTVSDLVKHFESLFKDGMTWNNYGISGWHIDHKIPISWWEIESAEDPAFKQCWALDNLQPLWASENCSKQDRYI